MEEAVEREVPVEANDYPGRFLSVASSDDGRSATPAPQTLRHPSLYLSDGDIALSAQDTEMLTYIFRAHRLFLSHYSEGFRDLISTAADGQSAEEYDGVPLVRMPEEDTAEEVAGLLKVIYDISALPRMLAADERADAPLLLSSLLDISGRYKIPGVVAVIKDHIRKEWPTTLSGWAIRQLELKSTGAHGTLPEPVSAIQFATTYDIPSILPAAFYHLAILPTKHDWRESREAAAAASYHVNVNAARWSSLDGPSAVRFAKGRDAMVEYYFAHVEDNMEPPVDQFNRRRETGCTCDFSALQTEIKLSGVCQNLDPLQELQTLVDRCDHLYRFCEACLVRVRGNFARLRVDIWNELPYFFAVGPWALDGLTWDA